MTPDVVSGAVMIMMMMTTIGVPLSPIPFHRNLRNKARHQYVAMRRYFDDWTLCMSWQSVCHWSRFKVIRECQALIVTDVGVTSHWRMRISHGHLTCRDVIYAWQIPSRHNILYRHWINPSQAQSNNTCRNDISPTHNVALPRFRCLLQMSWFTNSLTYFYWKVANYILRGSRACRQLVTKKVRGSWRRRQQVREEVTRNWSQLNLSFTRHAAQTHFRCCCTDSTTTNNNMHCTHNWCFQPMLPASCHTRVEHLLD